jgi:hypothetical protein
VGSIGRIFLLEIGSLGDRERAGSELRAAFLAELLLWCSLVSSLVLLSLTLLASGLSLLLSFLLSKSKTVSSKSKKESSSSSFSSPSSFSFRG